MRLDRFRAPAGAVVTAALVTAFLAACGGDDDEAQSLTITASGSANAPKLKAPTSAETGLAEITIANRSNADIDAQMLFVEGDHSPQEVIAALGSAVQGKEFPEWFFGGGGGQAADGETVIITQVLKPGTYYVVNAATQGAPKPADLQRIEVTGEESDAELPETDATVTAVDYGFETDGVLPAGSSEITFENAGAQPHHIIASRLADGATIEEAEKFLKASPPGQGPFVPGQASSDSTSVLEGGTSQTVTLELKKPGTYALYCLITDRQGGPPHVIKGMVDEVEVE